MLIHEVCKNYSFTKKAMEYSMKQRLISPTIQKNHYRNFSDELQTYLDKTIVENIGISIHNAIEDPKKYLAEYKKDIEHYIAFKQSKEFKTTSYENYFEKLQKLN